MVHYITVTYHSHIESIGLMPKEIWLQAFFSILQTAIANGIDAKLYLKTLIEKIGSNPSEKELKNLLPWKIEL